MMKRFGKWIGYLLLFLLFVVIFLPKKELYFQAEHLLRKKGIFISDERVKEHPLWLDITNGTVYANNIKIGSFEQAKIYPDLLVNLVSIKNFRANHTVFPQFTAQGVTIFFSPIYPVKLFIEGSTSFGTIKGWFEPASKKGIIEIFGNPKELVQILNLQKIGEGHYRYAFDY